MVCPMLYMYMYTFRGSTSRVEVRAQVPLLSCAQLFLGRMGPGGGRNRGLLSGWSMG